MGQSSPVEVLQAVRGVPRSVRWSIVLMQNEIFHHVWPLLLHGSQQIPPEHLQYIFNFVKTGTGGGGGKNTKNRNKTPIKSLYFQDAIHEIKKILALE